MTQVKICDVYIHVLLKPMYNMLYISAVKIGNFQAWVPEFELSCFGFTGIPELKPNLST